MRDLRLKQAAVARKTLAAKRANGEKKPHRSKAQIEAMKEKKRTRDRERRAQQRRDAPDAELSPEQLKKREDNRRYRANKKARLAGKRPSQSPEKQREYQARYQAKKAATKTNGSGHSEPQEMHFPLEAIPDRVPSSLRERGPSRVHAAPEASVGGVNAKLWFAMELLRFVREA